MHDPLAPDNKVPGNAAHVHLDKTTERAKRAWLTRRRNAQQQVTMKCLSVRQPWANAIFMAGKDVENRAYRRKYRGPLLIHASLQIDSAPTTGPPAKRLQSVTAGPMPTGAIIGVVRLLDVVENSRSKWAEPDKWHWLLAEPQLLAEPITCAGKLGIFEVEIPLGALKKALPKARAELYTLKKGPVGK